MRQSDGRGFEDFDNPLAEPERRRLPKVRRPLSAWEEQALRWGGPVHGFVCCGTLYRWMTPAEMEVGRAVHTKLVHGG